MANEITATGSLSSQFPKSPAAGQNPEVYSDIPLTVTTFTKAAALGEGNTMSVPTTAGGTALPLGGVTTVGWAKFVNLDVTNFVQVGTQPGGTFRPFLKLKPGEWAIGPLDATNPPFALADTGAVLLQYMILQR